MSSTLKILWKCFWPLSLVFAICNAIIYNAHLDIGKINDKDFLFSFIGLLLGFALTIYAFIMSMIDKIRDRIEKEQPTQNTISKFKNTATELFDEIKENIYFTFFSLVIVAIMYILKGVKSPEIHLGGVYYFSRTMFSSSLKLSLFFLNIYAIYDLIAVSFKISDTTAEIKVSGTARP